MQHSIIVRVAWGLSAFLLVVAVAFAWSANQRERHYAALSAAARQAAATSPASGAGTDGTATTPAGAAADAAPVQPEITAEQVKSIYGKRCAKCHEPEEVPAWVAERPAGERETALFEFLQSHRKAKTSEDDNRVLAAYFAAGGGV